MNIEQHSMITKSTQGKVSWLSPSNIAIVKYWGKHGRQLPNNTSLSLTLSEAHTITSMKYAYKDGDGISVQFLFEGEPNLAFEQKIIKFLTSIRDEFPFLDQLHLHIESSNSFPHSSGIASSASAMSAIAMCLCSIENVLYDNLNKADFYRKASHIARLGSGSASRSVIPEVGIWGAHPQVEDSSDRYAVKMDGVHEVFKSFHDDILIISADEKSVSSTAGHALMIDNPYAEARYQQANDRIIKLMKAMREGDVKTFGKIAEDEAMTLHALMMCSDPSYILMKPDTLVAINKIRAYRAATGVDVYFTLDAGPNIHLLYPDHEKEKVAVFVKEELEPLCDHGRIIRDCVGTGPKLLKT